jgi:hypothetical protein
MGPSVLAAAPPMQPCDSALHRPSNTPKAVPETESSKFCTFSLPHVVRQGHQVFPKVDAFQLVASTHY